MSAGTTAATHRTSAELAAERVISRLLIGVTYASVVVLLVGVALLFRVGIAPDSGGPALDLGRLGAQLADLEPAGFLWLGLLALLAAPACRVAVALVAYVRDGDWLMVIVSVGILAVLATAILSAAASSV